MQGRSGQPRDSATGSTGKRKYSLAEPEEVQPGLQFDFPGFHHATKLFREISHTHTTIERDLLQDLEDLEGEEVRHLWSQSTRIPHFPNGRFWPKIEDCCYKLPCSIFWHHLLHRVLVPYNSQLHVEIRAELLLDDLPWDVRD